MSVLLSLSFKLDILQPPPWRVRVWGPELKKPSGGEKVGAVRRGVFPHSALKYVFLYPPFSGQYACPRCTWRPPIQGSSV